MSRKFGNRISSVHGDADSKILLMELPWRFEGQKFGIQNSIGLFDLFAQKNKKGVWNSEFRTSVLGIAMAEQK